MKTCCITGRVTDEQALEIQNDIKKQILYLIGLGYTHFISGFDFGADLIFAGIVADLKRRYPITLEAAIPYPGRMKTPDKAFQNLIRLCDFVQIHSASYNRKCCMKRNHYMVDRSHTVIAVYDGSPRGGTAAALRYAVVKGRRVTVIRVP